MKQQNTILARIPSLAEGLREFKSRCSLKLTQQIALTEPHALFQAAGEYSNADPAVWAKVHSRLVSSALLCKDIVALIDENVDGKARQSIPQLLNQHKSQALAQLKNKFNTYLPGLHHNEMYLAIKRLKAQPGSDHYTPESKRLVAMYIRNIMLPAMKEFHQHKLSQQSLWQRLWRYSASRRRVKVMSQYYLFSVEILKSLRPGEIKLNSAHTTMAQVLPGAGHQETPTHPAAGVNLTAGSIKAEKKKIVRIHNHEAHTRVNPLDLAQKADTVLYHPEPMAPGAKAVFQREQKLDA